MKLFVNLNISSLLNTLSFSLIMNANIFGVVTKVYSKCGDLKGDINKALLSVFEVDFQSLKTDRSSLNLIMVLKLHDIVAQIKIPGQQYIYINLRPNLDQKIHAVYRSHC